MAYTGLKMDCCKDYRTRIIDWRFQPLFDNACMFVCLFFVVFVFFVFFFLFKFNLYWPSVPFLGHRQTVQTQIRRRVRTDQGLHCMLIEISIKNKMKIKTVHQPFLEIEMDSSN